MSAAPASSLYVGWVGHARSRPKGHRFRYPVFQLFLDLDELAALPGRIPFFGYNRRNLVSIRDRDYMGPREAPVKEKLAAWLQARGKELNGKAFLLTNPRFLGYVFNPVSYYYLFDEAGRFDAAIAEINNTFGETYAYLLTRGAIEERDVVHRCDKVFHVSPFIPVRNVSYVWRLSTPGGSLHVHIDEFDEHGKFFEATLAAKRHPLSAASLARALLTHPHQPLRVIAWIHWQALRLWLKRLSVVPRPPPPADALRRSA